MMARRILLTADAPQLPARKSRGTSAAGMPEAADDEMT